MTIAVIEPDVNIYRMSQGVKSQGKVGARLRNNLFSSLKIHLNDYFSIIIQHFAAQSLFLITLFSFQSAHVKWADQRFCVL
jgi:hypothetical protein